MKKYFFYLFIINISYGCSEIYKIKKKSFLELTQNNKNIDLNQETQPLLTTNEIILFMKFIEDETKECIEPKSILGSSMLIKIKYNLLKIRKLVDEKDTLKFLSYLNEIYKAIEIIKTEINDFIGTFIFFHENSFYISINSKLLQIITNSKLFLEKLIDAFKKKSSIENTKKEIIQLLDDSFIKNKATPLPIKNYVNNVIDKIEQYCKIFETKEMTEEEKNTKIQMFIKEVLNYNNLFDQVFSSIYTIYLQNILDLVINYRSHLDNIENPKLRKAIKNKRNLISWQLSSEKDKKYKTIYLNLLHKIDKHPRFSKEQKETFKIELQKQKKLFKLTKH